MRCLLVLVCVGRAAFAQCPPCQIAVDGGCALAAPGTDPNGDCATSGGLCSAPSCNGFGSCAASDGTSCGGTRCERSDGGERGSLLQCGGGECVATPLPFCLSTGGGGFCVTNDDCRRGAWACRRRICNPATHQCTIWGPPVVEGTACGDGGVCRVGFCQLPGTTGCFRLYEERMGLYYPVCGAVDGGVVARDGAVMPWDATMPSDAAVMLDAAVDMAVAIDAATVIDAAVDLDLAIATLEVDAAMMDAPDLAPPVARGCGGCAVAARPPSSAWILVAFALVRGVRRRR